MTFGQALEQLRAGKTVARGSWSSLRGVLAVLPMGRYGDRIYVLAAGRQEVWSPINSDLLADDWIVRESEDAS